MTRHEPIPYTRAWYARLLKTWDGLVKTGWPEFRTGKRAKKGQGGRRKRSRRNCRRYAVDLAEFDFWSSPDPILPRATPCWYWSMTDYPEEGHVGPFANEREARADARKRVS